MKCLISFSVLESVGQYFSLGQTTISHFTRLILSATLHEAHFTSSLQVRILPKNFFMKFYTSISVHCLLCNLRKRERAAGSYDLILTWTSLVHSALYLAAGGVACGGCQVADAFNIIYCRAVIKCQIICLGVQGGRACAGALKTPPERPASVA